MLSDFNEFYILGKLTLFFFNLNFLFNFLKLYIYSSSYSVLILSVKSVSDWVYLRIFLFDSKIDWLKSNEACDLSVWAISLIYVLFVFYMLSIKLSSYPISLSHGAGSLD